MRFAFDEDQTDLRDAVRDLLANECSPEVVRAAWESTTGRTATAWDALTDMGVVTMTLPPDSGGLGMGALDWVLVLEETGRAALPEPIVETAVVGLPLLAELGAPLPAAGASIGIDFARGASVYVDTAASLIHFDSRAIHIVDPSEAELTPERSVDRSRRRFRVMVPPGAGTQVAKGVDALVAINAALYRGGLGVAAQLIGLADRMLTMTVEYVSVRHQFGKPVGAQQAIKHKLADVAVAIEFARPLVYRAAWSVDRGDPEAGMHVAMAKAQASDAAELASAHALQCHGAIGYSFEYDLHLYMKRAWCLSRAYGDAGHHRERVAQLLLD